MVRRFCAQCFYHLDQKKILRGVGPGHAGEGALLSVRVTDRATMSDSNYRVTGIVNVGDVGVTSQGKISYLSRRYLLFTF